MSGGEIADDTVRAYQRATGRDHAGHREACLSCRDEIRRVLAAFAPHVEGERSRARAACADELRAHATAETEGWLVPLADRWDGGDMTTGQQGIPQAQVDSASLPPLAQLVTDEDVQAARKAADAYAQEGFHGGSSAMRAALEAYGARLLARLPSGLPPAVMPDQE